MPLSLDYVFIITQPGAPIARRLIDIGLIEGNANIHPGQGTSNRRFFLDGFTIELLYVSDPGEAANGAGKGLGILTRSLDVEANPFGIMARTTEPGTIPTFPGWQYFPDYFDGKMCFYVGDNSDQLKEPLCICMPPSLPKSSRVPDEYANPGWKLTSLEICVPVDAPTEALTHFAAIKRVRIMYGKPHIMTMIFNNRAARRLEDISPDIPLTVEW